LIFFKGATAAQIIPEVVESASHVTVFQRSPNWILDRNDALISPTVRSLYQYIPFLQKRTRASMMDEREQFHQLVTDGESPMAEQARTMTVRKLLEVFPHDEEMRRKLTPDFHPGCKRVILSDTYLPALSKPNCTLETKPITRITKGGIIVSDDKNTAEEAFDLIVFATGFRAVDHLHPLKITGAWGRSLDDIWKGGARALYGVTLEDMPNFGVLYGPNTNLAHNSLILQIESQAKYVATLADMVLSAKMKGRSLTIVPRRNVLEAYNEDLQRHLGQTSFADNRCESWFKDKTGLITTNWSGTAIEYQKMMSIVKWEDYELEGSGAFEARKKKEIKLNRVVEETLLSNRSLFLGASAALTVILWVVAPRGVSTWIN
jgi:cation diffusion facilitator CzcD-associated flavoprotein CzcO